MIGRYSLSGRFSALAVAGAILLFLVGGTVYSHFADAGSNLKTRANLFLDSEEFLFAF